MNKYDSREIVHVKDGDLEYIQFKILNELGVKHCITLRHGGYSEGELSSLNFRTLGQDKLENVLKNLEKVRNSVGFSKVHKATQAHTDKVMIINDENESEYEFSKLNNQEYDGYIVDKPGIATLITTADCNPIIILDKKNRIVANVHAGWKGVINRIYINAIKLMQEKYGSNVEDLVICIGPSIRKCCFTSQEESFKEKFTSVFGYSQDYLEYDEDGVTFHIDLIEILKHEFRNVGVSDEQIHVAPICTRSSVEDFFSYRYAVQNKQNDYATMATIVELK